MHYIGQRISGDHITCCPETNFQDLSIAAINSINGYYRKNNLSPDEVSVREVIEDENFSPWTKTILWNAKCKKGAHVSKRKNLTTSSVSLSEELVDASDSECFVFDEHNESISSFLDKFNCLESDVLEDLVNNPSKVDSNVELFEE